jgi:DNA-binding CsgD family transcriptional regulator
LDRHEYSVNWIKSNRKLAAALPRKELANFLGISNSSLKTYLNEAMEDA